MREFLRGAAALGGGIAAFWARPRWWLCALPPAGMALVLAGGLGFALRVLAGALGWDGLWASVAAYGVAMVALFFSFATLYELFGGLFFDGLTARAGRALLGLEPRTPPFAVAVRRSLPAMGYACVTAALFLPALLLLLVPVVGWGVWVMWLGWRFGVSYLFSGGLVRGERVRDTLAWARAHRLAVAGFGIPAYLLLSLPFVGVLFVPGFVVGAVLLRGRGGEKMDGKAVYSQR